MDCDGVRDALQGGAGALAPELAVHAEHCPICAALVGGAAAALGATTTGPRPREGLRSAVMRDLERERGFAAGLRGRSTVARAAAVAAVALAVVLVVLATNRRPDLGVIPIARVLIDAVTLVVAALVLGALALRPLQRPSPSRSTTALALGLAVLAVALAGLLPPAHDHSVAAGDFGAQALACFAYASACALPVLVVATWASRYGEAPWRPLATSAVLAACVGALAVWLHCPLVAPSHLLVGHATVVLPLVALATLARARSVARARAPA